MQPEQQTVTPGPNAKQVRTANGQLVSPPADWELLPPGDPGLTRRVKSHGQFWLVQEKKGRRTFSKGIWAPAIVIQQERTKLVAERSTETYQRKQANAAKRRSETQAAYVDEFADAVKRFLNFHPAHAKIAEQLTAAVTAHATPVGSGTVARTKRIPVERRAEAAVIAWMRHQTTAYDSLVIPRVKGKRREIRRMLAARSHELLERYRSGASLPADCPLKNALP